MSKKEETREELKTCPFCGKVPKVKISRTICKTFDCPLHNLSIDIEKWNRRDPLKGIRAEYEKIQQIIEAENKTKKWKICAVILDNDLPFFGLWEKVRNVCKGERNV